MNFWMNFWRLHTRTNRERPQQSNTVTDLKEERNYRIITTIFGILTFIWGAFISLNPSSNLVITSILTSMGISSLFHSLLGGVKQEEILEIQADGISPKTFQKLAANLKISGPVVTFFLVTIGMYLASVHNNSRQYEHHSNIKKILENVNLKYVGDQNKTIDGLLIDESGVYNQLLLTYQPESEIEEEPITIRKAIISEESEWQQTLNQKDLTLNYRRNNPSKNINFDIKDGRDTKVFLGFLEHNEITNVLTDLAEKTLKTGSNTVTNKIFKDCLSNQGTCQTPDQMKVAVSFSETLGENEAYVCPKEYIDAKIKVNNKQIWLTESLNNIQTGIEISKITPYEPPSPCFQGIKNWIQIKSSHKTTLFKNTNINKVPVNAFATFF